MLGFLHTAAGHVPTFERLVREHDAAVPTRHAVEDQLLADATAAGTVDAALAARVIAAVEALRAEGAHVVVCTCSTIGDAAEAASRPGAPVLRIDRPMAEEAVRRGTRIAVVAALDTALQATTLLVHDAARAAGRPVAVYAVSCPEAWPFFVAGDTDGYLNGTAAAVRAAAADVDVIVLGQVSMAGAVERLSDLTPPVLAAATTGVRAAIALHRSSRS
jgi:Asp/Glu/Hydantoin racemase